MLREPHMAKRTEILWEGQVVGWIHDVSCDNFNVFGRWESAGTAATESFLQAVGREEDVVIQFGQDGLWAYVGGLMDEELEVKLCPRMGPK
jgi:hypothetical protein